MRITATLAGAVLGALLMLPAAAQAESLLPEPPSAREHEFAQPEQADLLAGLELAGDEAEGTRPEPRKRKKPQFQTRFFAE